MIQRIQTVFLIINFFFLSILYFFLPLDFFDFNIFNFKTLIEVKFYIILCGLLTFLSVLLFKKRTKQLLINKVQIFLHIIYSLIIVIDFIVYKSSNSFINMLIPTFCLIFISLANKFIKRDEDLIKSIDRIR